MGYLYLAIAIIAEVIATAALTASAGFSRLLPSVVVVVGYVCAFYFLSLVLRYIPVGVAYAIWSGLGTVLITLVGVVIFDQKIDAAAMLGMFLIISGVFVMNVFSTSVSH